MFYKIILVICTSIVLSCCSTNTISPSGKKNTLDLPFFNKPDWTPEWINKTDSAYKFIHTIPSFSFIDQQGNTITNKTIEGKIVVTNFFFTNCRGICPKMTSNMYLLQEAFKNDSTIIFLSHSVSPETDKVAVLNKYALENKVNSKRWHLLTGDKEQIYELAKKQYFAGDSVGYYQTGNEFLHTENFILIDKQKRIRGVYNGTLLYEIDRIKEDILTLAQEN
jgi:protein SCO1/2